MKMKALPVLQVSEKTVRHCLSFCEFAACGR